MTAVLGVLAYLLVTCVLGTLAARVKSVQTRHDLIVDARRRRLAYLKSLADDEPEQA